jgi:hypothetical protein
MYSFVAVLNCLTALALEAADACLLRNKMRTGSSRRDIPDLAERFTASVR